MYELITKSLGYNPDANAIIATHTKTMYMISTFEPVIGKYTTFLGTELPASFISAICVDIEMSEIATSSHYWNNVGEKKYTFSELLPPPYDSEEHTKRTIRGCSSNLTVTSSGIILKATEDYCWYDHSYLSLMTDDQLLQHIKTYGDNSMVELAIVAELNCKGKRIKCFQDGSYDKIVKISKPKVKQKTGLSKSELNSQKEMLRFRFERRLLLWSGCKHVYASSWVQSQYADKLKLNKKFMNDIGWTVESLLEFETPETHDVYLSIVKNDPKNFPELIAWWNSIVVD